MRCSPRSPTTSCCRASDGASTGKSRLALEAHPSASGASKAAHRAELAHHWSAARDDERAFEASLLAAEAAEEAFAFEAANGQYENALELWLDVADPVAVSGGDHAELIARTADGRLSRGACTTTTSRCSARWSPRSTPAPDPVRAAVMRERLGRYLWLAGSRPARSRSSRRRSRSCPPIRHRRSGPGCCRATASC